MARPHRRKSGVYIFRQRIPADIAHLVPGKKREIVESLDTKDPQIAQVRFREAEAKYCQRWSNLRSGPIELTARHISAVAGEIYRETYAETNERRDNWISVGYEAFRVHLEYSLGIDPLDHEGIQREPIRPELIEEILGWRIDSVLQRLNLHISENSRERLLEPAAKAALQAVKQFDKECREDFRPDPDASRFASVEEALKQLYAPVKTDKIYGPGIINASTTTAELSAANSERIQSISFDEMFDAYAAVPSKFGKRRPKTLTDYKSIFKLFELFLREHRSVLDPLAVVTADVAEWRNHLLGMGRSAKTIKAKHLAAIRAVYQRQVDDGAIRSNPVGARLMPAGKKQSKGRERGFTATEAAAILKAARTPPEGRRSKLTISAIRWAPWIAAYTGARIGEVCQLRKQDFKQTKDGWQLTIAPEAGSVKTDMPRTIPLHDALVAEGLTIFVLSAEGDYLFIKPTDDRNVASSRSATTAKRVGKFVRADVKIKDVRLQPNHAWRHRFTTRARLASLDVEKREYILGHAIGAYGDMAGLHAWMKQYPSENLENASDDLDHNSSINTTK